MTNRITNQPTHSSENDVQFADDGLNCLESTCYESDYTELSITSRDVIVANQWVVSGKIGEGSFGEVFKVRDINTKQRYAIKREHLKTKHSQVKYETTMYDVLSGGVGIPTCHWHGNYDGFECIVMDLLGPSLGQVRQKVSSMELDIAIDLVYQMVSIVEEIHNRGVVVRDIKPDNFLFSYKHYLPETEMIETMDEFGMPMISYKKKTCRQVFNEQWGDSTPKIYAIDFGLACYWRDPKTGETYPDTKKHLRGKTGTARYASINVHRGRTHSRRDDMESISYVLLDILLGNLPWAGVHARNSKAGWDKMRQMKMDTFMNDFCAGLPMGVLKFVEYSRKLAFDTQPDYEKLRQYLKGSLPGGAYSELVKSPFGGKAKSSDNYDMVQHEHKLRQQKELELQQQILEQCNKPRQDDITQQQQQYDDGDENGLDRVTQQFVKTNLSQPNNQHEDTRRQRKSSTASQSSIDMLLKENLEKAIGWNTYKHDQEPWNPKTTWMNDDEGKTGSNVARSWGDDDNKELVTWGEPPMDTATTQGNQGGSWGNVSDSKQVQWNEQQLTSHHDEKKEALMTTTTNWGEQPSWNSATAQQKTTWREQPSWDSAPAQQETTWDSAPTQQETTWGKSPQWDKTPSTTHYEAKKPRNRDHVTTATWNQRPSWDITPTTKQHDKKIPSKHRTTEPKRGRNSSWKTTQQSMKESRNSIPVEQDWRTTPRTSQHDRNHTERRKENSQSNWETKQDYHDNYLWSADNKMDHVEQQWKEANSYTKITEQVDGWQRQPGSNTWQQKRRPLAK